MIKYFLSLLAIFCLNLIPCWAEKIVILPDQCPQLEKISVEGKDVHAMVFNGEPKQSFRFPITDAQKNWQKKSSLVLRLYSPENSGAQFVIFIRSSSDSKELKYFPSIYHWKKLSIDWKGWTTLTIPLDEITPSSAAVEAGLRTIPPEITQIIFGNQFGPKNPEENKFGIPEPQALTLGIEQITVE